MIVATAGHIDHGKTLLTKALTGIETDRLPEEKARGISIDLGFAHIHAPKGELLSFIDVPGHEDFIRNMVAGVMKVDVALILVAADDGIMPQTIEHVQILNLLSVRQGILVITKIDRVESTRVQEVSAAAVELLGNTNLQSSPIHHISSVSGYGVDGLRSRLFKEAEFQQRLDYSCNYFRLAIDRVFTINGSGTVITGTVLDGIVHTGDKVLISPAGIEVRVRAIQSGGNVLSECSAGMRCALNLTAPGFERQSLRRGDVVQNSELHHPSTRLDVRINYLLGTGKSLKHWTPVHVHIGTASTTGRVWLRSGVVIEPGKADLAILVLDEVVNTITGDKFILRDQAGEHTIGGGTVIDPFSERKQRHTPERLIELQSIENGTFSELLLKLVHLRKAGVDLKRFESMFNVTRATMDKTCISMPILVLTGPTRIAISIEHADEIKTSLVTAIRKELQLNPQSLGLDMERASAVASSGLPKWAFSQIVRQLADTNKLSIRGNRLSLAEHDKTLNAQDDKTWNLIEPLLIDSAPLPPSVKEVSSFLNLPERQVMNLFVGKARNGDLIRIMDDRFCLPITVRKLAEAVELTAAKMSPNLFSAANYRDSCGTSRKMAILILEFFDKVGFTQRIDDGRRIKNDIDVILSKLTK
jgi:selenocysteine-specific elongation factor